MNSRVTNEDRFAKVEIDLKNPVIAGVLAWLWPGAGHLYQGRIGKGLLYMICILVTYFWGLAMGDGHVVYASFRKPDFRYPFVLQAGIGIPAFPAILQKMAADQGHRLFGSDFMAPPRGPLSEQQHDELALWHQQLGFYFELGTLYTMIAGLLNMLVIYDAVAGPMFSDPKAPAGSRPLAGADAGKNQSLANVETSTRGLSTKRVPILTRVLERVRKR